MYLQTYLHYHYIHFSSFPLKARRLRHSLSFFFFLHHIACLILVTYTLASESAGVLTTGQPEISQGIHYLLRIDFLRRIPHELFLFLFCAILHCSFPILPIHHWSVVKKSIIPSFHR